MVASGQSTQRWQRRESPVLARSTHHLLLFLAGTMFAAALRAVGAAGPKSTFFDCANRDLLSWILARAMGRGPICRAADGDFVCITRPGSSASPTLGAQ